MNNDSVHDIVDGYKTNSEHGYSSKEIESLLDTHFPDIDHKVFYEKLGVNTGMIENGVLLTYHCDIERTLNIIIEDRDMYPWEFD